MATPPLALRWVGAAVAASSALGFVVADAASTSHRAVIPTTIGLLIAKRKKKKGELADGDASTLTVEPSQPITKFMFGAVNEQEYGDVDLHVDADLAIFLNGLRVDPSDLGGQGTLALAENLENWRKMVPDLHWTLLDEVVSKDRQTIAVRFTVSGTHTGTGGDLEPTGATLSYEVSAFIHLADDRLREFHQTVDLHQVLSDLGADPS